MPRFGLTLLALVSAPVACWADFGLTCQVVPTPAYYYPAPVFTAAYYAPAQFGPSPVYVAPQITVPAPVPMCLPSAAPLAVPAPAPASTPFVFVSSPAPVSASRPTVCEFHSASNVSASAAISSYQRLSYDPDSPPRSSDKTKSFVLSNASSNSLFVRVAGVRYLMLVGQTIAVDVPADFDWQIEGRDVEHARVPAGDSGLSMVIRR